MSRRPSFRNPFPPASPLSSKDGADGTAFSSSGRPTSFQWPFSPCPPTTDAPTQRRDDEAHTGHLETGEPERPQPERKGSFARIRDVRRGLGKLVKRWAGKQTSRSEGEDFQPVATLGDGRGPAPPRPPRPTSLDAETMALLQNCPLPNVGPELRIPISPDEVDMVPVVQATRNHVKYPEVVEGISPSSFEAELLHKPQSTPPRQRRPPTGPPTEEGASGSRFMVGVSPSPLPTRPPANPFWTVVQRNTIRVWHDGSSRWLTGGVLGAGGFGRVYLVYNIATREQCAMKVVDISKPTSWSCCRGLINELKVMSMLGRQPESSPFLLKPYLSDEHWAWRSSKYLHILTETCTGGELFEYRQKLSFKSLTLVCAELILGLNYLHQLGIVHHDVKPHNILVSGKGHCVIVDFGGARFMDASGILTRHKQTVPIMTTAYAAPELLFSLEDDEFREYDERVDFWSLAATMVSLIMDDDLLPGTCDRVMMDLKLLQIRRHLKNMPVPHELLSFVMDIFKIDPEQRPKFAALKAHPFFRVINWDDVLGQKVPAIPFVQEVAVDAYGCKIETPKVHLVSNANADFLEELRKAGLSLSYDDSYDVDRHHAQFQAPL